MLSKHFQPIERGGYRWDAGMILFEFDALREPEKTQFPKIGEYLRGLGMEFNEVKPQMLWCGHFHPDLYIANQLDAVPLSLVNPNDWNVNGARKQEWPEEFSLASASRTYNGIPFHEAFIEPMCQKILGIPSSAVVAKYHRTAWLPLFFPQTLREKKNLPTKFWYPKCGYAGIVYEKINGNNK